MKKISATDTLDLSIPERIQLVEDIWDTIAAESQPIELSEDEKRLVDERLEAYHSKPDSGNPWEDIYKGILSRQ
ncbi:putative addiction module component [bacterium BMS3Abin07]|nr:putative addiction module component [bacterium BMS3Abin07]GBE32807.1 putative addiction module component [bacterium BMS3Bbin05]